MTEWYRGSRKIPFDWPVGMTSNRLRRRVMRAAKEANPGGSPEGVALWLQRHAWKMIGDAESGKVLKKPPK